MIRIERNPTRQQLCVFGTAWLVFFGILGGMACWKNDSWAVAAGFFAVGVIVPAIGVFWPGLLRIVFLGTSYATFPIGILFSNTLLALVYFLVLAPLGVAMRLRGHDPLRRRFDRAAKTYWTPREREEASERYFRQF